MWPTRKGDALFGKYLRKSPREIKAQVPTKQFVKPVPPKAYGRPPSLGSQHNLYHDEDHNYATFVSPHEVHQQRIAVRPYTVTRTFRSEAFNFTFRNLRLTLSALHEIHKAGSLDDYIRRTPPEELRSLFGEKLRDLMRFYEDGNQLLKQFKLPPKMAMLSWVQKDPYYARHLLAKKRNTEKREESKHQKTRSPYFLPTKDSDFYVEKQRGSGPSVPINKWWQADPQVETAFRKRLRMAHQFERFRDKSEYGKGKGRGGGGKHGVSRRPKKAAYNHRVFGHGSALGRK